jgi:pimeloyl-ACP methyl ester carboxylesterase
VALALRARLGDRIPQLVLIDWLVLDVPPSFRASLAAMKDPARCRAALDELFTRWTPPGSPPAVTDYVRRVMAAAPDVMWARAARAIEGAYARTGSPLAALARLAPPPPTLHVYAIPKDEEFLSAQTAFAARHPWFHVERLTSGTHFPTLDAPDALAEAIARFTV